MGFFGEIVDECEVELDVPNGYELQLVQACLDIETLPPEGNTSACFITLFVQTANTDEGMALCHLRNGILVQAPLSHVFGPEDSPVSFWTNGGRVYLTGRWLWDRDEDTEEGSHCCSDEECEICDQNGDDRLQDEKHVEELEKVAPKEKKATKRTRSPSQDITQATKQQEIKSEIQQAQVKKDSDGKEKKKRRKTLDQSDEEVPQLVRLPSAKALDDPMKRKVWRVKPESNEGVVILEPKQLTKPSGVLVTDYVLGKGLEPKRGSKVSIIYEGMFPDGKIFDANLKRTKPLIFRTGTGQVIRGLDYGMEGMRTGGSREIVVPSELGYGKEGFGEIPGNQTLVFRVTLLGAMDGKKSKK